MVMNSMIHYLNKVGGVCLAVLILISGHSLGQVPKNGHMLMERQKQRIIILGDPHVRESERALWEKEIIPDINRLRPDLVLVLGDLSGGKGTGTDEGARRAVGVLSQLKAPWHSIIGNHDLQGEEFTSDEEAVAAVLKALGREKPGFTVELDSLAVIGLDNTFWRRNTVNKNEIVIDDAQLTWWQEELRRLGDKPVIMLGHAPPIGSGLMVMPELHARVGNAYMNQNHEPGRIQQIIWEHPNIVFWFSGHNHLGHQYRDAISRRLGVCYAHTCTASRASSRDASRHSRILDIEEDGTLRLRTFDHDLRRIDPELDLVIESDLNSLVQKRKRMLGKRFVPAHPLTMEQDAGQAKQRFVFLSDAHSVAPLVPIQKRIAAWCAREIRALSPDRIILGGDITHRPIPAQAEAFREALGISNIPTDHLPGNDEGRDFPSVVRGCVSLGDNVFLLATSNAEEAGESVDTLLKQLPDSGSCLVFAHFPPHLAGEERMRQLEQSKTRIYWVCGHKHEALESTHGSLHVIVSAGLDPVKARHSVPELLVCDWDGHEVTVQRRRTPHKYLSPAPEPPPRVGVAFRGTAETILSTAIERRIPAIQFHYKHSRDAASEGEKTLAQRYRDTVPGAFLSLHLPNFPHPAESVDLADQEPWLQWARDMGLDDLTAHPPDVPANFLFDQNGDFQRSVWAEQCLQTYASLAERALQMGAQISVENVYNKKVNPPDEERLGSQPWHLLRLVEAMRERAKVPDEQKKKIGIIFDAGHAFADVQVAKFHGLADWLSQVAPYLQLAHIHQVTPREDGEGTQNHRPIVEREGPRINHTGLLAAFHDASETSIPLLIEVRGQEDALESWEVLRDAGGKERDM